MASFIFDFLESIIKNPWVILFVMIGTPIGIITSFVFFIKSKRKVSFKYCMKYSILIEDFIQKINGLVIKYFDKSIKTLTVEKIVFWNNGNETIRRNDIPSNDNFSITIKEDYSIFDVAILFTSNSSSNVSINLSEDNKNIYIDFEYLDKHDGFILQVFHNGDVGSIIVNGSIIGFGKIRKGLTSLASPFSKLTRKWPNKIRIIFWVGFATFSVVSIALSITFNIGLYYLISLVFLYSVLVLDSRLFTTKLPKILKKHYDQTII